MPHLHPRITHHIEHTLRWPELRPIQRDALVPVLAGHNALIVARTAGGKTEAAAFPLFSRQLDEPTDGVGVLWVAPLRALINQVGERLVQYGQAFGVRVALRHSDVDAGERREWEREGSDWLVTTPESIEGLLLRGTDDVRARFGGLRSVVVDETHAFMDGPRGTHVLSLIERLSIALGRDIQRIGLSATIGNPDEVLGWLSGASGRPQTALVHPPAPARRRIGLEQVDAGLVGQSVANLVRGKRALVFCPSRRRVETLVGDLRDLGVVCEAHHGDIAGERREAIEERLRGTEALTVVCTSTLELGIDLGDLELVVQIEAPDSVASFMQRLGRTGRRAGQVATTSILTTSDRESRQAAAVVSLAMDGWVEPVAPTDVARVFEHQLIAAAIADGGLPQALVDALGDRVEHFNAMGDAGRADVLAALRTRGQLVDVCGVLMPSADTRERYSGAGRADLCAVFGDGRRRMRIVANGEAVGLYDGDLTPGAALALGGTLWRVAHIDGDAVEVLPATDDGAPNPQSAARFGSAARVHGRIREEALRLSERWAERPAWLGARAWEAIVAWPER